MRSIWTGSISFALINIPVRLYSATDERALSFDMLHKTDLSPIRFARICQADGKEIPYEDIVKGYEYEKGSYVVVDEKDFKNANPEKTSSIEILQFADAAAIDPIYYEKPYYLEPNKGGSKAYALLYRTLEESHKVAVVKYVFRNKEHIGVLLPYKKAIILNQMRFASEIRKMDSLDLPKEEKISTKEIDIALKLVDQLSEKFHAEKYRDEFTQDLLHVIEQKVKGHAPRKKGPAPKKSSKIVDITSLLEQSLSEVKHKKPQTKKLRKAQ